MSAFVNPKVKICGLTRPEDVEAAIQFGADYLGFIVEAKSKRRLSVSEAAQIALPAKGIIPRVAVTVNADDETLKSIVDQMQPDFIQFHGDETPAHIAQVSQAWGVRTIKALAVTSPNDMSQSMEYAGFADCLLFDAKPPKGDVVRGGHGVPFNWDILRGAALPSGWFLAGGLTVDNIRDGLKTGAPVLDVSSGVESRPGMKDPAKIAAFMKAAAFSMT